MNPYNTDEQIFPTIDLQDQWIYNKYSLAKMQDLLCDIDPNSPLVKEVKNFIIRPIFNLQGMSRGAKVWISISLKVPPGHFWCEYLKGDIISIDFTDGKPTFACKGIRDDYYGVGFDRWIKIDIPKVIINKNISDLIKKYRYFNIEMIQDKVIDAHPNRINPDWKDRQHYNELVVINQGDNLRDEGTFVIDQDYNRLGFICK